MLLGKTDRGKTSINVYGLNRAGLVLERKREILNLQNDFFALIVATKGLIRISNMKRDLGKLKTELGKLADPSMKKKLQKMTGDLIDGATTNEKKANEDIEKAIEIIKKKLEPDQPFLAMKRDIIKHEICEWPPHERDD